MPDVEPTNSTTASLATSSAATHSAGMACPPVPPPAIRILGRWRFDLSRSFTVLRNPVQDTHGGEAYQEAGASVAHEGERHTGEGEDDHGGPHVEDGLHGQHRGKASGHAPGHHGWGVQGDFQPGQRDKPESGDHGDHPDQAQFLPDQGEDHISTDLWHVGSLSARARTGTEEPPGLYSHHCLDHLVAGAVRGRPGVEKRHEPLTPIRLEQHHPRHGSKSQDPRQHQIPCLDLRGPEHTGDTREQNHGCAEVRFDQDQSKQRPDHRQGLEGEPGTRRKPGDRATQEEDGGELGELRRLHGHRTDVEPSPGAVDLTSNPWYQDQNEAEKNDRIQTGGVSAPRRVPDAANHEEDGHPEHHVDTAFEQKIGVIVPVRRRIDHDEAEQGEPEGNQKKVRPQTAHRLTVLRLEACFRTNLANASPRSTYPENWSKLAHPGESRTTSPDFANASALWTASSRSGALWTT